MPTNVSQLINDLKYQTNVEVDATVQGYAPSKSEIGLLVQETRALREEVEQLNRKLVSLESTINVANYSVLLTKNMEE